VFSGHLQVLGDDEPQEAAPGSMFAAPRGQRHGFSNPSAEPALALGIRAPPEPAPAFMRDIGATLTPGAPPDPALTREIHPACQPATALISSHNCRQTLHTRQKRAITPSVAMRIHTAWLAASRAVSGTAMQLISAIHTKVKSSLIMRLSCGNTLKWIRGAAPFWV
jgi:hypothetical protein